MPGIIKSLKYQRTTDDLHGTYVFGEGGPIQTNEVRGGPIGATRALILRVYYNNVSATESYKFIFI